MELLSIIVPVYNEKENIAPLINNIRTALNKINYEIIFVDDGSNDNTKEEIISLLEDNIILVEFNRNYGQTSALAAGIEIAQGDYIATIDGDLQNDPDDIPIMLNKLKSENSDIVVGRRLKRQDKLFLRKIPSKIANFLIRKLTKVNIRDYGCTLKIFKSTLAKRLDLYGELHRFIPILAHMQGAKITEIDVKHHARIFGQSKYGLSRTLKVVSDLLLMYFFQKYKQKPMHLFGNLGICMFIAGFLIETYLLLLKIFGYAIGGRPLFYVGILLIITSVQLITTGFLAEQIMRTYYGSQQRKPYLINKIYRKNDQEI
ncbi:MAG: glycosyltransferase family 2 protein [Alphaproteobacteria bacterium]